MLPPQYPFPFCVFASFLPHRWQSPFTSAMVDGRNFVFEENPKTEFNPGLASLDAITFAEMPFIVVLYSSTFKPLPPIAISDLGSWSSNTFPAVKSRRNFGRSNKFC